MRSSTTAVRCAPGGDCVALHVVDYAGIAVTNSEIDVEQCEVYEVAGGLVVESWVYVDPGELFRQMAAHPGSAPVR